MEQEKNSWPGWETTRLIGRGSFAEVYEIRRDMFGDVDRAALKVMSIPRQPEDIEEMRSDGYDEESICATFQSHLKTIVSEYSLMRKMNGCSNVVHCDDIRYIQHDDGIGWDIYIKMELLTPLVKALPKEIDEQTVIKIGKDLCSALVLCKKHGIIHRDIKPQNIFVSDNGEYKLGDFGIAKTVEKTMAGTMIGTYKYMAPEVYNNQAYGSAADICSLGLVLYWLLNERRMPFVPLPPARLTMGIDEAARIRRLRGEPIPAPAHGSDELKEIVLKACEYMPDRRFSSGAEMLEALTALSTGQYHAAAPKVADPQSAPIPEPSPVEAPEIAADADDDRTVSIFGGDRQQAGETAAEETVVPPKDIDIQTNAAAPAEKPSDRKLSAQDAQEALLSLIQEMDAYENPSEKAKKKSDKRIAQKGDDFVELLRLFRNG